MPQHKHKVLLGPRREAPCEGRPQQEVLKGTGFAGFLSSGSTSELKPLELGGADVFSPCSVLQSTAAFFSVSLCLLFDVQRFDSARTLPTQHRNNFVPL